MKNIKGIENSRSRDERRERGLMKSILDDLVMNQKKVKILYKPHDECYDITIEGNSTITIDAKTYNRLLRGEISKYGMRLSKLFPYLALETFEKHRLDSYKIVNFDGRLISEDEYFNNPPERFAAVLARDRIAELFEEKSSEKDDVKPLVKLFINHWVMSNVNIWKSRLINTGNFITIDTFEGGMKYLFEHVSIDVNKDLNEEEIAWVQQSIDKQINQILSPAKLKPYRGDFVVQSNDIPGGWRDLKTFNEFLQARQYCSDVKKENIGKRRFHISVRIVKTEEER